MHDDSRFSDEQIAALKAFLLGMEQLFWQLSAVFPQFAPPEELRRWPSKPKFAPMCASVNWYGYGFTFSPEQGGAIWYLYTHYQSRIPEVRQLDVREAIGSNSDRLADLFAKNSCWGSMLQSGERRGHFRLVHPAEWTPKIRKKMAGRWIGFADPTDLDR